MAGCGLLSSFLRRKSPNRPIFRKRLRRAARRDCSKGSAGTITSSDDEEYDSSGSLRQVTKHSSHEEKAPPQRREQPEEAQFNHLLTSLSNVGPCFGIDLPGCGLSNFAPTSWDAYTVDALAELLATAIDQHRDKENGQGVVLIAHSLGCSLSALLASSTSSIGTQLKEHILGLIAVCPRSSPPSPQEVASYRRLLHIPGPIFDLWRHWDRRGGLTSASVTRLVGAAADSDTRKLQVRYNKQSKTPVWRRMAWGTLPTYDRNGSDPVGGLPGRDIWAGVETPVLLVAGESDTVTKPEELQKILRFFEGTECVVRGDTKGSHPIPDASSNGDKQASENPLAHEEKYGIEPQTDEKELMPISGTNQIKRSVKTVILPAPASHALLYDRATYRTLAGVIQDFLRQHIDHRLNMGWQLQYLNTSGKWDVKNLAKWQKVTPVSERIANTFVALKMLREVDEEHNPVLFSQKYRDQIYAVIDISYENPVYNPASMENGGIHYHKHPTVSKIPPTTDETRDFIALVDRLENEITEKLEKPENSHLPRPMIGQRNRDAAVCEKFRLDRPTPQRRQRRPIPNTSSPLFSSPYTFDSRSRSQVAKMGGVTVRDVDVSCHPSLSVSCCFKMQMRWTWTMDLDSAYGISWQRQGRRAGQT
ncbi:hypothetical protein N8T08_005039 [Aspergillus melleus]|uniref:Uncharacterized protein n=1 Tax=Aspergillus melleus TaxID=138277 RepID=A0ACC3BFH3_9EURO|nr:hypothetical protein N8T08_005039 [Aspergillus melleus]